MLNNDFYNVGTCQYGNAPPGEHYAIFSGVQKVKYPKGIRIIFNFLLLDEGKKPKLNNAQEYYFAVAVCNESEGKNPKSKVYKICNALLPKENFNELDAVLYPLSWEELLPKKEKNPNIVKVKVKVLGNLDIPLSKVTHIERVRDKVWQNIESLENVEEIDTSTLKGKFLQKLKNENILLPKKNQKYLLGHMFDTQKPWINKQGEFAELTAFEKRSLNTVDEHYYESTHEFSKGVFDTYRLGLYKFKR